MVFAWMLTDAQGVRADPIQEAQSKLDLAHAEYQKALSQLVTRSREEYQRLEREIVSPAQQSLNKAKRQELKSHNERVISASKTADRIAQQREVPEDDSHGEVPSKTPSVNSKDISPKASDLQEISKHPNISESRNGPLRPEFSLDGKDIPKEIEFGTPQVKPLQGK